ncbi:MAG: class I SAM-dependent methyltransferase [Cyclobacteriaceae bacterium]
MMKNSDGFVHIPFNRGNLDRYYHRLSIRNAIEKSIPHLSGTLLDAGCGKMPYRSYILDQSNVTEYIGLDIENARDYSDEVGPDITWDGKTMPFENDSFDCAIATEVLEHVPDTMNYLNEVYRVLKTNGVFFFTTPFLWPLHEIPYDEYRFTPFAMDRLLKEVGFTNSDIQALGGWNASLAQMLGLWLRRSPMHRYQRRFLSVIFFPFYKYLIKSDKVGSFDAKMITGISGLSTKS